MGERPLLSGLRIGKDKGPKCPKCDAKQSRSNGPAVTCEGFERERWLCGGCGHLFAIVTETGDGFGGIALPREGTAAEPEVVDGLWTFPAGNTVQRRG